jgi:cytoskeletal protein CcmA (bactofilin family)
MKSFLTACLFLISGGLFHLHAQTFTANLSGSNQPEFVTSMATGSVTAELDGNTLTVSGSFDGLTSPVATEIAGGAHIHLGLAGQNGAVGFVLTSTLDSDQQGGSFMSSQNMFELSDEQKDILMQRGMYVNIHTAMYQNGELRGQLVPEADQVFRVLLTGNNQSPTVQTDAMGTLIVELRGHDITVSGSFNNLSSPLATEIAGGGHIHMALAGQNGAVIKVLTIDASDDLLSGEIHAADNMIELEHEELMALLGRELYVNIHSLNNPGGELRGQILADNRLLFQSNISGAAQTTPVNTEATGKVVAELIGNSLVVTGSFSGLSSPVATEIAGGAHIHNALAGTDGAVIFVLDAELSDDQTAGTFARADNTFELTDEQIEQLFARGLYINIHTAMYNGGEIRGQILPVAQTYLTARLSGLNEVIDGSPIETAAGGLVLGELTGSTLTVSGSFMGLESALATEIAGGAHLHTANAGSNGAVAKVLTVDSSMDLMSGTFMASDNMFTLTDEERDAVLMAGVYVNIHSVENQSGEIRGQLLKDIASFPMAPMITAPAEGAMVDLSAGGEIMAMWSTSSDAGMNPIVYIWEVATDEAFTNSVVWASTGMDAMISVPADVVDMILADAGVELGGTATIYHRAYASNGSFSTPGEARSVILTRATSTSVDEFDNGLPTEVALDQNYPNPFNPTTQIQFALPQEGQVSIQVYNMVGQVVATLVDGNFAAGRHTVQFDARDLSSGMYIYRLTAQGLSITNKMTLVK